MSEKSELHRPELIHSWYQHCSNLNAFLEQIDLTGGWPNGYKFVLFYHGEKDEGRKCKFDNYGCNSGWWTRVCSSDDYYWWKLSDAKKKEVVEIARKKVINSILSVDSSKI